MKKHLLILFLFLAGTIFSEEITTINTGIVNVYLIEGNYGLVLVDTGMKDSIKKIENVFKEEKISFEDIKYIVLTHGHGDHLENVKYFKDLTGAKIICHQSIVEHIKNGDEVEAIPQTFLGKILNTFFGMKPFEGAIPDITFDKEFNLNDIGLDGIAMHTPGHSKGSITLLLNSGQVLIGDQLRKEGKGYGLGMFYDNKKIAINSLKMISNYDFDRIYLSHGDIISREEFNSYNK